MNGYIKCGKACVEMKITKSIICLLLVSLLIFSLSSCGALSGGDTVMRYGSLSLNESDYLYIASVVKDSMVYYYQYYLYNATGTVYGESDILAMQMDENGKTISDYVSDAIVETAKRVLIIEKLCADAGITITDQSSLDEINSYVDELEYAYGGQDLFEIELAKMGFTRSSVERYERFNKLISLYSDYRYGDSGTAKIPSSTVNEKFLSTYFKFEGCIFSFKTEDDEGNSTDYLFDYTDDEIKTYFDENYAKVKHILYRTVDSSGKALSDEEVAKAKADAEAALDAITKGEKTIDDFASENDDSSVEYTFTHDEMVDEFENAAFDMTVGEVRLVKTEYGYHVVEKEALTDTDLNGTVGDDGKTTGGKHDEVIKNMSTARIRAEAEAYYEKLKSGETTSFNTESKDYYYYEKPAVITSGTTNYSTLETAITEASVGDYILKEISGDGVFVVRKLELTGDDITDDIYSTIEKAMISDTFYDYIISFNDVVEVDNDVISRFTVASIPALDDKFYS